MSDLWVCVRLRGEAYQGWCGTRHRFHDRAVAHTRSLNGGGAWTEWETVDFNHWCELRQESGL